MVASDDHPEAVSRIGPADRIVLLLVGLSPALFALATWAPGGPLYPPQGLVRGFSLPISAVEIVVIVFAIFVGLGPLQAIVRLPRWAIFLLGTLVAIPLVTAMTFVPDPGTAQLRTYAWIIHLLFGFSLWRLLGSRWSALRPIVWPAAVTGVLLYILIVAAFVAVVGNDPLFPWKTLGLGVTHVRQTGFYSLVGAAAALGLAAAARSPGRYWLATGAASLCLALSYWSGTRGSVIAIVAAFAAGLVLLPALRSLRAVGALLIANVAGALVSLLHQVPHSFYGVFRIAVSTAEASDANELTSFRLNMWRWSAEAVLQRPFFGYGESQFRTAVPVFAEFNHPHNFLLQAAVSWGLVGLACVLALGGLLAWHFLAAARRSADAAAPAFLVAAALVVMAMYEGSLYHPYPVMMAVVAAAFVLSAHSRRGVAGAVPSPTKP